MKKAKKASKKVVKKVTKVKVVTTASIPMDSVTEKRVKACIWTQDVDGSL